MSWARFNVITRYIVSRYMAMVSGVGVEVSRLYGNPIFSHSTQLSLITGIPVNGNTFLGLLTFDFFLPYIENYPISSITLIAILFAKSVSITTWQQITTMSSICKCNA